MRCPPNYSRRCGEPDDDYDTTAVWSRFELITVLHTVADVIRRRRQAPSSHMVGIHCPSDHIRRWAEPGDDDDDGEVIQIRSGSITVLHTTADDCRRRRG